MPESSIKEFQGKYRAISRRLMNESFKARILGNKNGRTSSDFADGVAETGKIWSQTELPVRQK